MFMDQESGR